MNVGDIEQTIVKISHKGSLEPKAFVLEPGNLVVEPDGSELGDHMTVKIETRDDVSGWTEVLPDTQLTQLQEIDLGEMNTADDGWSEGVIFRFTTTLSDKSDYKDMGASVSQPLPWKFDTASND